MSPQKKSSTHHGPSGSLVSSWSRQRLRPTKGLHPADEVLRSVQSRVTVAIDVTRVFHRSSWDDLVQLVTSHQGPRRGRKPWVRPSSV